MLHTTVVYIAYSVPERGETLLNKTQRGRRDGRYLGFHCSAHRYDVDECGLAGVLQAHERELHLFLPEETLDPLNDSVDERKHLASVALQTPLKPHSLFPLQ